VPPRVRLDDEHPLRRVQFRLWQITIVAVTVLLTGWSYTLHVALGLTATFLAKHVLVAVLAAGLELPPLHDEE
jgi:hypothetical protein